MRQRRILFTGLRQLELADRDLPPLGPGQVLVRTEVSLMSTGTENICFNRLFAPGTHFDRWVKYPFEPGYSCVGVAEQVGAGVESVKPGDRVAHSRPHASCHVVDAADCFVVPSSVSPEHAVWFALARIAYNGARRFSMEGMNTHRFSPEDAAAAYRLANESRGETMGILFEW